MKNRAFLVTTSLGGVAQTRIWKPSTPMGIGHPFRWVMERTGEGVSVRPIASGNVTQLTSAMIEQGQKIDLTPDFALQVRSVPFEIQGARAIASLNLKSTADATDQSEIKAFKQALKYTSAALGAVLLLSWVWPQSKSNPEEIIPPQFTKIVMTQPKRAAPEAATPATANTKTQASAEGAKKIQKSAVVQAFRAKALQNAVSGLLKGGMTTLLTQSEFVSGAQAQAQNRKLFDGKSDALRSTAPMTGAMDARQVQVASLEGAEGAKGGVGYRKGEKAQVQGQGKSFVSIDSFASTVQEGLTKEEVGEVIHRHMSEIRYCYESAMLRVPDIEGKLMVDFTIGGGGLVKATGIKSSTLPDPRLDDCILRRLASWKFPQPKGGIDVAVTYPFIFKTLGR